MKNKNNLKNVKDLEYKKLLNEYNAYLIGSPALVVAIMALFWQFTFNIGLALLAGFLTLLWVSDKKDDAEGELIDKIVEIKNL